MARRRYGMHPGDDDQPRWPEGTPVRPDGHGPGGGRFRGTGDIGGANVDDLVGGLQGASSRPWYETAAGQIAQRQAGGHPRVGYNLAVINAAQAQYNENRGDGFHDDQLPQLIGQYNVAEAQGNPAGQDVAVDQLRSWIDSHYPEQWAGALPARVEAREAPRAPDQDQRNQRILDQAQAFQSNIEANTGDPDDALAIRIEALERHVGRTGHRVEADREAAALRQYMDSEMDQEAAQNPVLRRAGQQPPVEDPDRSLRLVNAMETPDGGEVTAAELLELVGNGHRLEVLGRHGWDRVETVDVSPEGDHFIYLENDPEPISMSPDGRVAIRFPQTPESAEPQLNLGGEPSTNRDAWNRLVVYLARQANYQRQQRGQARDEVMDQMVADIEHPDVTDVRGVADSNSEVLRQRLERVHGSSIIDPPPRGSQPPRPAAGYQTNTARVVAGFFDRGVVPNIEVMGNYGSWLPVESVREEDGDFWFVSPHGAEIARTPDQNVDWRPATSAFERQHQAHIDRLMSQSDGLDALDDRDLRDLAIEYGMNVSPPPVSAADRATMIEHIRRQQRLEGSGGAAPSLATRNVSWADTQISHQRPGFYRVAVDDYEMPLQIRDAEGQWRTVRAIGHPTDGLYEILHDGPTGRTFVPENHPITVRIGSDRSGTTDQNRRRFNVDVALMAEAMLEQVDPEDRADDEGYTRLRAKLDIYDDATANQSDQESIDSAVDDLVNELADWDIYFDVPPYQNYDSGGNHAYFADDNYDGEDYMSDDEDFDQGDIPELHGDTRLRSAIEHWPDLDYNTPGLPDSYRDRAVQIWDYTDPITGYRSEVDSVQIDNSELEVKGNIYGPDGSSHGYFTRTIDPNKPHEVHHAYFKLYGDSQGGGFSTRWLESVKNEYRQQGFTQISVDADIDVGGYAWAKAGFDFAERYDMNAMLGHLDGMANNNGPLSGSVTDLVKRQIAQLQARAARGEHITPLEISMIGWDERVGYRPVDAPPVTPNGDTIEMWFGKEFLLRYGNSNKVLYNNPAGYPVTGQGWRGIIQL